MFLQYISAAFLCQYFDHRRSAYGSDADGSLAQSLLLIDNLPLVRYLVFLKNMPNGASFVIASQGNKEHHRNRFESRF
jgi:hypothetical protein